MSARATLAWARLAILVLLALMPAAAEAQAQVPAEAAQDRLLVGTREAPPFAMRTGDGLWEGISISLLQELSQELGFDYELKEVDLAEMIDGVAAGRLDGAIAAMTITADRERVVDFSHPFYRTGLGVAVSATRHVDIKALIDVLTSRTLLGTIGLLLGLLLAIGSLIWWIERKHNSGQFERRPAKGLFSGFWWAAVTMTTVGYGDKTPITTLGRVLAVIWMFMALALTAIFTAQVTAGLTSSSISSPVTTINDLPRVRVGNLADSASLGPLRTIGVRPVPFATVKEGLEALADNRIEAFVHDAPILKWEAGDVNGVRVTPLEFAPQDYGIVLPPGAPTREEFNLALLQILASDRWSAIQRRYLGE